MPPHSLVVGALFVGVVATTARAQTAGRWYEVADGQWRVPASVVEDMRRDIGSAARDAVSRSVTKEQRSIAGDTVQYQGTVDSKTNQRQVQLYGMCETRKSPSQLRDYWAYTYDGGNCYYWARYDPARRKFLTFDFNSAA